MRPFTRLTLLTFALLTIATATDAAAQVSRGRGAEQQRARDQVCVYQDIQYRGWEQCYNAGDELAELNNRKDAISSIRIFGRARITVYEGEDFEGRSAEFDSNIPDLGLRSLAGSRSWSDRIESFRVGGGSGYVTPARGRGWPFGNRPNDDNNNLNDSVCVYEHANYQGRSQCFSEGEQIRDLGRQNNWSDRISSIRLFGRGTAVLYRDIQFQGERLVIDQDIPDLAQVWSRRFGSWNDQVSSLSIEFDRRARLRR